MKKIAIDAYYVGDTCHVVGGIFNNWTDEHVSEFIYADVKVDSDYVPGEFYKRELPGILKLLEQIDLNKFDKIIIDGYVYLQERISEFEHKLRPGLGRHLYALIKEKYPKIEIVGVAKTLYGETSDNGLEYGLCYRGNSKKPLYVTSTKRRGKNPNYLIERMAGEYRIPTIIKEVDSETKKYWK